MSWRWVIVSDAGAEVEACVEGVGVGEEVDGAAILTASVGGSTDKGASTKEEEGGKEEGGVMEDGASRGVSFEDEPGSGGSADNGRRAGDVVTRERNGRRGRRVDESRATDSRAAVARTAAVNREVTVGGMAQGAAHDRSAVACCQ